MKFATLNARGIQNEEEKELLVKDASEYNTPIMVIPETHIPEEEHTEGVTYTDEDGNKVKYILYSVNAAENSHHGVGFLTREKLQPNYEKVSNRIAKVTIEMKDRRLVVIGAYAPTLEVSEKDPAQREEFYEALHTSINNVPNRDILIVAGDFNAKTGSLWKKFPQNMGKYGKGHENSSGRKLLELCTQHDLVITNTLFQHKLTHRTTWTAPMRIFTTKDGTTRKNPVRNQIDYIMTRRNMKHLVHNSRSYGGTATDSDHKMVIAEINIDARNIYKQNRSKKTNVNINVNQFQDEQKRKTFEETMSKVVINEDLNVQEKWNLIVNKSKEAGKEILGKIERNVKHNDDKLKELSEEKKKLKTDKDVDVDKTKREKLREIRKDIRNRIKEIEENSLQQKLQHLENTKNDSNRYFKAIRDLQQDKKKEKIYVRDDNKKMAGGDDRNVELITKYFKNMFSPPNKQFTIKTYQPMKMKKAFTGEEIRKATKGIKNNKAAGPDELNPEFIKYAPIEIHTAIAEIYNTMAETGEHPEEIKSGILAPLQKPGKTKGERKNLRPIMLLSILRKTLTIAMINRTWDRISQILPKEQSAYQPGRSTTEQVLAIKIMCEKAINSSDFKAYLALFDMSKAFDNVDREKLFEYLEEILDPDELHIISLLINTPKIRVRVNGKLGELFTTLLGILQGDCLSAILFIIYLAKTLRNEQNIINPNNNLTITPKYADDTTYFTTSKDTHTKTQQELPKLLKQNNLEINNTKTELYEIPKPKPPPPPPPTMDELIKHKHDKILWSALDWLTNYKPTVKDTTPNWKNCKLLGSYLGTEEDIQNRKQRALETHRKFEKIFKSKIINTKLKIRTFNIYVACVFLYNSETWSMNKTLEDKVDSFQRRLLRYTLGIQWPDTLSNEQLLSLVGEYEPWSKTIRRRRLNLLGHIMRLSEETPVRRAIYENFNSNYKNKVGRPKHTWLHTIREDLARINIQLKLQDPRSVDMLIILTKDRVNWRKTVRTVLMQ